MTAIAATPAGANRPEFTPFPGLGRYFPNPTGALLYSLGNAIGSAAKATYDNVLAPIGDALSTHVGERFKNLFENGSFRTDQGLYDKLVHMENEDLSPKEKQLAVALAQKFETPEKVAQLKWTMGLPLTEAENQLLATSMKGTGDWDASANDTDLADDLKQFYGDQILVGKGLPRGNNAVTRAWYGFKSMFNSDQENALLNEIARTESVARSRYGKSMDKEMEDDQFFYLKNEEGKIIGKIVKGAPRVDQRDNATNDKKAKVNWKNMCNLTIGAALLAEKRATSSSSRNQLEDELYEYFKKELPNNPKFPGKKPSGDVFAAMKMAIDPNFDYNVKFAVPNKQNGNDLTAIIKAKIDSGTVVGVSGLFKRPGHKNGDAAHIIEIVGYNDKGWIVNDPFGKFANGKWGHSGMQGTMELYEYGQHDLTKRKAYWLEQKR